MGMVTDTTWSATRGQQPKSSDDFSRFTIELENWNDVAKSQEQPIPKVSSHDFSKIEMSSPELSW